MHQPPLPCTRRAKIGNNPVRRRIAMALPVLALLLCWLQRSTPAEGRGRSNVLYLVADDLRPEMAGPAPYAQKQAVTPNIDKLASSAGAVTFSNAYCQQAVCGPSRNSFM
jgi:iduronate 2-sulfatase